MSDLIDRQAAIEVADAIWCVTGDKNVAKVWDQLKDLPSAQPDIDLSGYSDRLWQAAYERGKAEAVEVVRCKDCIYGIKWDERLCCEWHGFYSTESEWYCADGERKEAEDAEIH